MAISVHKRPYKQFVSYQLSTNLPSSQDVIFRATGWQGVKVVLSRVRVRKGPFTGTPEIGAEGSECPSYFSLEGARGAKFSFLNCNSFLSKS